MRAFFSIQRMALRPTPMGIVAVCAAGIALAIVALPSLPTLLLGIVSALLLARSILAEAHLRRLAVSLDLPLNDDLYRTVERSVGDLASSSRAISHRMPNRHSITDLPTRELLVQAMSGRDGVLGIIDLIDFDRLCAISPDGATQLLVTVAKRISRMTGENRLVAHVDRSRFAIWFEEAEEADAKAELQAICYALQDRLSLADGEIMPVVRSGHLLSRETDAEPDNLLARAFSLLTAVENKGEAAGEALDHSAAVIQQDFRLEQDLRQALNAGEFELCYQPFIDVVSQRVCGAEALIRWRHVDLGLVSPSIFIPIAEKAGLTEEIGQWALNSACRAAQKWTSGGLQNIKVAVNVSAHQLDRGDLAGLIKRTLATNALSPTLLEVELTETAAAVDSDSARRLFATLREIGVAISIDDFGAGYSSLSYLKKLNFDKLKIDREFVTHVDTRHDSQAICQSIIALGRGLGIQVLAEGAERIEEVTWLQSRGCHLFQGFHFSQPLSEAAFVAFAQDQSNLIPLLPAGPGELRQQIAKRMAV